MPNINIFITTKLHKKFKVKCAKQNKKLKDCIIELIQRFVK